MSAERLSRTRRDPDQPAVPDEPIELAAWGYRSLRETIAPFETPELIRAVRTWWLTAVLPGPVKYARALDDGDLALLWAEVHDLRRWLARVDRRENPPA